MTNEPRNDPVPGGAKDELRRAGEELRGSARSAARRGGHEARSLVEEQQEAAAEHVRGMADAIESSADELGRQGRRGAASQLTRAAGSMRRFSDALTRRDLDEVVGEVQDYARRHPGAAFGIGATAGLLLTRFLKASDERRGVHAHDRLRDEPDHDASLGGGSQHGERERAAGTVGAAQGRTSSAQTRPPIVGDRPTPTPRSLHPEPDHDDV